jgi:hypothetical protein
MDCTDAARSLLSAQAATEIADSMALRWKTRRARQRCFRIRWSVRGSASVALLQSAAPINSITQGSATLYLDYALRLRRGQGVALSRRKRLGRAVACEGGLS